MHRDHPVLATALAATFRPAPGARGVWGNAWSQLRHHVARELDLFRRCSSQASSRELLASFDGPARAIRCACSIARRAADIGIEMTAGLHVGDCQAGMNGIHGHAVDLAREIEKHAGRGEILVSATVRDLVTGSGISFRRKGLLGPSASEVFSVMTAEHSLVQRIGA